ncbi:MAG: hypothetical protein IT270_19185 [Saprospiraceae bacterium]|nr:hypothetical protein [Saprospiraceae bacterium]
MSVKLTVFEVFLLETAVWLAFWLLNDYMATLLTLIIVAIVSSVLIIAMISEWIERSKVTRYYFQVMAVSVAAPLVAGLLYILLFGELTWLRAS